MEGFGFTVGMGPLLRAEVQRQLLDDLTHYGVHQEGLWIDWSETCPEGHVTTYLDGRLENWSSVLVRDAGHHLIAEGWIDFIHGGDDNPLFVFWDLLTICKNNAQYEVKKDFGIPVHVWECIPAHIRQLCIISGKYDSYWHNDPLVIAWAQAGGRDQS